MQQFLYCMSAWLWTKYDQLKHCDTTYSKFNQLPEKIVTIENTASAVYLISFVYEILSEDYLRKLLNENCIIVERVDRVMDASWQLKSRPPTG